MAPLPFRTVDKSKLPASLFSALGISLILAYNRGLFDKIDWSTAWSSFDAWMALEAVAALVLLALCIEGLVKFSYWVFPKRDRH